jgi:hypothetical protein
LAAKSNWSHENRPYVSLLIATALAEKISVLVADDYLRERVESGSRQKFEKALE